MSLCETRPGVTAFYLNWFLSHKQDLRRGCKEAIVTEPWMLENVTLKKVWASFVSG